MTFGSFCIIQYYILHEIMTSKKFLSVIEYNLKVIK